MELQRKPSQSKLQFSRNLVIQSFTKVLIRIENNLTTGFKEAAKSEIENIEYANVPKVDALFIVWAQFSLRIGNYQKAVKILEDYIEEQPKVSFLLKNTLGLWYLKVGLSYKAEKIFEEAKLENPDCLEARNNLANINLKKGDYESAKAEYEHILQFSKKPSNEAVVWWSLAYLHFKTGNLTRMFDYLKRLQIIHTPEMSVNGTLIKNHFNNYFIDPNFINTWIMIEEWLSNFEVNVLSPSELVPVRSRTKSREMSIVSDDQLPPLEHSLFSVHSKLKGIKKKIVSQNPDCAQDIEKAPIVIKLPKLKLNKVAALKKSSDSQNGGAFRQNGSFAKSQQHHQKGNGRLSMSENQFLEVKGKAEYSLLNRLASKTFNPIKETLESIYRMFGDIVSQNKDNYIFLFYFSTVWLILNKTKALENVLQLMQWWYTLNYDYNSVELIKYYKARADKLFHMHIPSSYTFTYLASLDTFRDNTSPRAVGSGSKANNNKQKISINKAENSLPLVQQRELVKPLALENSWGEYFSKQEISTKKIISTDRDLLSENRPLNFEETTKANTTNWSHHFAPHVKASKNKGMPFKKQESQEQIVEKMFMKEQSIESCGSYNNIKKNDDKKKMESIQNQSELLEPQLDSFTLSNICPGEDDERASYQKKKKSS